MKNRALVNIAALIVGLIARGCATVAAPAHKPKVTVDSIALQLTHIRMNLDRRMVTQWTNPATSQPYRYPPAVKGSSDSDRLWTTGYPAGVIYAGMLSAADATHDRKFKEFVSNRFDFFANALKYTPVPQFEQTKKTTKKKKVKAKSPDLKVKAPESKTKSPELKTKVAESKTKGPELNNPFRDWLLPSSLDSCGAMGTAFLKAHRVHVGPDLEPEIVRFANFVNQKQFRLKDGTLARNYPFPNSLWADDMYMGVPFLSQMGAVTRNSIYFDDAARQVIQLSDRLFVPAVGLYTHGWNAATGDDQPHYFWGRANGWCAMAMVELLDVLPKDHPKRPDVLKLLRAQAKGIASVQAGNGLWHQMLDRTDSFTETSCSAMFTYAIARAVNRGWLDANAYTPVALAGWRGISANIDSEGHITGTCVGTNYAADYNYYYNRDSTDDQHGYGPVLMAGSEIIRLLKNHKIHVREMPGQPVMLSTQPVEDE